MPGRRSKGAGESLTAALARLLDEVLLPDLRGQARRPDITAALAAEHARRIRDGRTGDRLAEWTERLLEQIGAAWILCCVFSRTLEDRRLVRHRRVAGDGAADAERVFFDSVPSADAGDYLLAALRAVTAYPGVEAPLRLATDLAFRLPLSGNGARALLDFFREQGDSSGDLRWRFEGTDTRFLGDLYQGLSAGAQKRHALLQTPVFVEELILDQTLEPALEEYGLDETHVLDPVCGSGHFLLGAFDRICEHRKAEQPGLGVENHARAALAQVHGADVEPSAAAITRFRLALAYLAKARIESLENVSESLLIDVIIADSLLAGGRPQARPAPTMFAVEDPEGEARIFGRKYQVVVGNPPYITCKDSVLREAYRQRYESAAGNYALSVPFTERFFGLAAAGGYVGMINSNSFMRREFGKRLVERVLPRIELTRIIDTSGAYIPRHGTPTVLLFGRNREPVDGEVTVVGGRRGEPILPSDPAKGRVWTSIARHLDDVGYIDDYISVFRVPRRNLSLHPWTLGAGIGTEILDALTRVAHGTLADLLNGAVAGARSGMDDLFLQPPDVPARWRLEDAVLRPAALGSETRTWLVDATATAIAPQILGADGRPAFDPHARWAQFLWRYRSSLRERFRFGTSDPLSDAWWTWSAWPGDAGRGRRIACPLVATHNHFAVPPDDVVLTGGCVTLRTSEDLEERASFALLGYLNSSTACYWMKQFLHAKTPHGHVLESFGMHPEDNHYEFSASMLEHIPVPDFVLSTGQAYTAIAELGKRLHHAAQERAQQAPARALERWDRVSREGLIDLLAAAQQRELSLLREMVRDQEDLDWLIYSELGFEASFERSRGTALPEQRPLHWLSDEPPPALDPALAELWAARRRATSASPLLGVLEQATYKRPFSPKSGQGAHEAALEEATNRWIADQVEDAYRASPVPRCVGVAELVKLLDRADVRAVCSLDNSNLETRLEALMSRHAVPYLPAFRYTESGMAKRALWARTWESQRAEDAGERSEAPVGPPPIYDQRDFAHPRFWQLRGKLDVPRERFLLYPAAGERGEVLFGWAGWSCHERAMALIDLLQARERGGATGTTLLPLLAGLFDQLFWVERWEAESGVRGAPSGEDILELLRNESHRLGVSVTELRAWCPAAPGPTHNARGRRRSGAIRRT